MKTDDTIELIEILDDGDDDVNFRGNGRAPTATAHDSGGPRWVGPVAALALIGLIGYGVASSSSSGATPTVEPITSTTVAAAPPTTTPAPTSTLPTQPLVPYYAADLPREYKLAFAELLDGSFSGQGDFQLWAEPGAAGTTGAWFSLTTLRGTSAIYAQNAYRLELDGKTLAIAHDRSGQITADLSNDRSSSVHITAVGWTDDEVVRLARSIDLDSRGVSLTDPSITAGYQMITTVQPWLTVQGLASEQVYYTNVADPNGGFGITVAPIEPALDRGGPGTDRQTALRFLLDHATPFTVDGHPAVAGSWLGVSNYSLATWTAADHIVTVSGGMPVPQLIALARNVHQVSSQEWDGMRFQATKNNSEENNHPSSGSEVAVPVPIAVGIDAAGASWTTKVSVFTFGNSRQINWDMGRSTNVSTPSDAAQINTFADNTRTYVLADLPRAVAATAELQVLRSGTDPFVVPFNDIDPGLDRTFAAYTFSETGPYTAQIVGADGTILASWPAQ